jgi:integral membrane protein (TIGR01906 family)
LNKALKLIFILILPLFLLLGSVRLLAGDQYLAFEYGKSNFPTDPYGYTPSQRLTIASANLRFVRENLAIEALSSQNFNGEPVYKSRELSHMLDVQKVYQSMGRVWLVIVLLILLTGFLLFRSSDHRNLPSAIKAGGLLTSGLIFVLGLSAIVAWRGWFTAFHQIFFAPGSWLFEYSDTLIRLFPIKFWFDSALTLLGVGLVGGLVLAFTGWIWRLKLEPKKGKESEINHLNVPLSE